MVTKWLKEAKLDQIKTSKTLVAETFIDFKGGFAQIVALVRVEGKNSDGNRLKNDSSVEEIEKLLNWMKSFA